MSNLILSESKEIRTFEDIDVKAREFIENSKAKNTVKSYQADWQHFTHWCEEHQVNALPSTAKTVARYLVDIQSDYKVSSLQRRLAAINAAHRSVGFEVFSTRLEPLHSIWSGITRTKGMKQNKKAPALTADIRAMVDTLDGRLIGIRDRALLLLGFAGALRRSELAALNVEDVEIRPQGLLVTIQKSKTDQAGEGQVIGIPYGSTYETCPVRAMQAWLEVSSLSKGALFRSIDRHGNIRGRIVDKTVARIVKRCAEKAGLDAELYAGHSLRAGLATSAALAGESLTDVMRQTRHKSERVARGYVRVADAFKNNVAARTGL